MTTMLRAAAALLLVAAAPAFAGGYGFVQLNTFPNEPGAPSFSPVSPTLTDNPFDVSGTLSDTYNGLPIEAEGRITYDPVGGKIGAKAVAGANASATAQVYSDEQFTASSGGVFTLVVRHHGTFVAGDMAESFLTMTSFNPAIGDIVFSSRAVAGNADPQGRGYDGFNTVSLLVSGGTDGFTFDRTFTVGFEAQASFGISLLLTAYAQGGGSVLFDQTATYQLFAPAGVTIASESGNFPVVQGGPAVPEPGTWTLLILGFGLTGAAARARRVMVR